MRQILTSALFLIACAMVMVGGGLMSAEPQTLQALLANATAQSGSE